MTRLRMPAAAKACRTGGMWLAVALLMTACVAATNKGSEFSSAARKAAETNAALGRQYMDRGQNEVALDKLKRAVANDKTYAPAYTLLGVLHERLGQTDQAGDNYRLAVKYDPENGDVNNNYAVYLCGQGRQQEADRYFQVAVKDPFYTTPAVAYANAGVCALSANEVDKAERYLRKSLEYQANFAAALLPMANVSYRTQSYLRARAFLQRYEDVGEKTAASLLLGYRIEQALGNGPAADPYLEALMNSFPNSAEAAQARAEN